MKKLLMFLGVAFIQFIIAVTIIFIGITFNIERGTYMCFCGSVSSVIAYGILMYQLNNRR